MYKSILVIADQDSDQHAAMQKARSVAYSDDISIFVVAFVEPAVGDSVDSVGEKNAKMQEAIDSEFSGMGKVSYDVVSTRDIPEFCKVFVLQNDIDLVIKTGHRTESLFHTPLDYQLVRELKCTVMISTLQKWRAKSRVMVTVDINSKNANQIALNGKVLDWAKDWANCQDCELHVAFCIDIPKALSELDIISKEEILVKQEKTVTDKIANFMKDHGVEYESISVDAGNPSRVLPSLANKLKADLVVLGSVGRKGVKGALLGNTAEKVMSKLRTDLAIVHPD
ncbi:MAG: universal stress protein [Pseudohongiellaceae bacterium]